MPASNISHGFSLLEVLIAMLLAAIALLGLAAAQLKALQNVSASLQHTYASLELQNVVERIWPELCSLQNGSTANGTALPFSLSRYLPTATAMSLQISLNENAVPDFTVSPYVSSPTAMPINITLRASWTDHRLDADQSLNLVELNSSFPWLRNGNPDGC